MRIDAFALRPDANALRPACDAGRGCGSHAPRMNGVRSSASAGRPGDGPPPSAPPADGDGSFRRRTPRTDDTDSEAESENGEIGVPNGSSPPYVTANVRAAVDCPPRRPVDCPPTTLLRRRCPVLWFRSGGTLGPPTRSCGSALARPRSSTCCPTRDEPPANPRRSSSPRERDCHTTARVTVTHHAGRARRAPTTTTNHDAPAGSPSPRPP